MLQTMYTPGAAFLAWLQKKRPQAATYFSEKKAYPMTVCALSGRHLLSIPGSHAAMPGAIELDRQRGTEELGLLLDRHPDTYDAQNDSF